MDLFEPQNLALARSGDGQTTDAALGESACPHEKQLFCKRVRATDVKHRRSLASVEPLSRTKIARQGGPVVRKFDFFIGGDTDGVAFVEATQRSGKSLVFSRIIVFEPELRAAIIREGAKVGIPRGYLTAFLNCFLCELLDQLCGPAPFAIPCFPVAIGNALQRPMTFVEVCSVLNRLIDETLNIERPGLVLRVIYEHVCFPPLFPPIA